jgi:diguanylate cyclase (GGDEF)-like protein
MTSTNLCRLFGQPPGWSPRVEDTLAIMPDDDRRRVMAAYEVAYREHKSEFGYRYRSWTAHGKLLHFFTHVRIEYDEQGRPARLLGATQDISDIVHYESRLHEMTFNDPLTNLPNRAQLYDRLHQAIEEAQRLGNLGGLLLLDLDRFQEVNDTLGHLVGDRLLCLCAERLREAIGTQDVLARLGGDEFAILVPGIQDAETLAEVAQELRAVLARPFRLEEQELYMSASVGIAVFPTDAGSTTSLLQYADSALNEAKSSGRSCHRFYSAELTVKSHERVQLEAALRRALANAELEVHYQPKVALSCGAWVGAEALLRWRHPALGLLAPDRFIGIAEETGLIVDIGAWVLREACAAAVEWNQEQRSDFKVAVNLSAVQVQRTDVVATVREVLQCTGCQPRWLELEITESLLLGNSEAVRKTLRSLRDMGVSIAIDDFGTGYSSLAYLKRFPIDVLKIDRSFTRDIGQDHDSTELVKAIITMARSLRLSLVAEGVEDMTQARFLQEQGCALAQGYLYARPMPRDELMQAWHAGCVAARRGDCPALSTSDSWLSAGIRKTVPT